jgi:transposase
MGNCAGIDWASEKHDVLIADDAGERLLAETFVHDEQGVGALCDALVCFEVEVVAIERGDGVLVERLLEAGVRVLALHPNQVKAARDRFRASGGKSDRFDCFVLCELARTDGHRFRVLEPDSDQTKALRALTRSREDLVAARVALANQLRAELERFWPGPIGLFSDLDSRISLAFLARYPSPDDARGLGERRMAAFRKTQHYSARKTPAQLLAGESVDEVAFLLGHRDGTVTRTVYVREVADARRRALRRSRMAAEYAGALRVALDGEHGSD